MTPIPIEETAIAPQSAWGSVALIAQAEQLDAPVFAYTTVDRMVTWVSTTDGRARHFAEGITEAQHELDLPTFYPQQQRLFTTPQGALKVWLDRNNDDNSLRIQASTLDFEGQVAVGIVPISDLRTRNFDIIATSLRDFRIVSSGGLGQVTNLYLHQIDDDGRPTGGDVLVIDADHPAMLQDNEGVVHLFWLRDNGRSVFYGQFDELGTPSLINVRQIASSNLDVTDAILNFTVGFDGTHAYLLWNIRRIDDTQLVLMSHGQLTDERFSLALPLTTENGTFVEWVNIPEQVQSPLPLVANIDEDLMVLWMTDGEIAETELIVNSGRLIGLPHIDTTDSRIGVSWAQPTEDGSANLYFVERTR